RCHLDAERGVVGRQPHPPRLLPARPVERHAGPEQQSARLAAPRHRPELGYPRGLGQGTDVVAGKSFVIPGIRAVGNQASTINLDPAVVQSWINNPSADQGILLVNESPGLVVRVNASENPTVSLRPKLSVTYTTGTPQPGSLQFGNATYSVNENGGTATV